MHGSEAANFHYAQAVARLSRPGDTKCGHEDSRRPLYQVPPWNEASCQRVSEKPSSQLVRVKPQGQRVGKEDHSSMSPPPCLWEGFSSSTGSLKVGGVTEMDSNIHGHLKYNKGTVTDTLLEVPSWSPPPTPAVLHPF